MLLIIVIMKLMVKPKSKFVSTKCRKDVDSDEEDYVPIADFIQIIVSTELNLKMKKRSFVASAKIVNYNH